MFAWGANECGQLGFDDVEERRIPALVPSLSGTGTAQISCGQQHSAAVLEDGAVFTWGCGQVGQLGHASESSRQSPRRVQGLAGVFCVQVSLRLFLSLLRLFLFRVCLEPDTFAKKQEIIISIIGGCFQRSPAFRGVQLLELAYLHFVVLLGHEGQDLFLLEWVRIWLPLRLRTAGMSESSRQFPRK